VRVSSGSWNWLRSPAPREVIERWTPNGARRSFALEVAGADDAPFEFLVVGDTGDSEASGGQQSPQDAVAEELARDTRLPGSEGRASLVLHVGDVVYMAGERRLYDRNFRRPYAAFLTPESTVERLVFRVPFLPVPGNHDYYDLAGWARSAARLPLVGASLRAVARELFAYNMPEGGSAAGRAFMEAFVAERPGGIDPFPYRPGEATRLPNRYYRFRWGPVDFFALDSNTLEAPLPSEKRLIRAEAARKLKELEERARALDQELRRDELALERWREQQEERAARGPDRLTQAEAAAREVEVALAHLRERLRAGHDGPADWTEAGARVKQALREWSRGRTALEAAPGTSERKAALKALRRAGDSAGAALRAVEGCLTHLPEGSAREVLLAAQRGLCTAMERWRAGVEEAPPPELCARLSELSQAALDVQRDLVMERRRLRYHPADHDAAQLRWLDEALRESERERPDAWRIIYLHHPLYSTIGNHCEKSDIQAVRENLMPLLGERVHAVFAGHSHAFEWLRSRALPHVGLFVTGGGGQVTLRRSILDPKRLSRHRDRYRALIRAGVDEVVAAGRGPAAADGENGPLYHYLKVEVSPDTLRVRPVGVRRCLHGYRREEPLPVYHAEALPEGGPPWRPRRLEAVEIRRDRPPRAIWAR
jgi:hypothetical protein